MIFEYTNYRDYLRDSYDFLKETTEYFSFRYFSRKAGFRSPNYLKLVIEGQRNISPDSIDRFAGAFKMNKGEAHFFGKLVGFNQAGNNSERAEFALKILQTKIYQKLNPLREEQLHYYQRWYQIAIRELALCPGFSNDAEWIAKQFTPELTVHEAQQAIDSLVKLGMLVKTSKNQLRPNTKNVTTHDEVLSSFVGFYHKQMMDKAKDSINITEAAEREISSICVPVSADTFHKMKVRIQDFKKELMALASEDQNPNRVYQLNLQLFPLTKKIGDS